METTSAIRAKGDRTAMTTLEILNLDEDFFTLAIMGACNQAHPKTIKAAKKKPALLFKKDFTIVVNVPTGKLTEEGRLEFQPVGLDRIALIQYAEEHKQQYRSEMTWK